MIVAPQLAVFLLSVAMTAPVLGMDIFRCLTSGGATEYRDEPCTPETDEGFTLHTRETPPTEYFAARNALREMREMSQAIDYRASSRMHVQRQAREAEAREREWMQFAESAASTAEPQYLGLPLASELCASQASLCPPKRGGHRKASRTGRPAPAIIQRTHQQRPPR